MPPLACPFCAGNGLTPALVWVVVGVFLAVPPLLAGSVIAMVWRHKPGAADPRSH